MAKVNVPKESLESFCQRYQVRRMALFGSVLRDDFRSDSDVDILVVFDPSARITFLTLGRMKRELSALFKRTVDLVPQEGLKPAIREAVIASAEEVYAVEKLYLLDMVESADAIQRFCEPVDESEFLRDELRQSAVLQKLIVIGEAAAHLSGEFRQKHSDIEWEDIVGFRNIAVHQYFAVLWQIVWETATLDVPDLRLKIRQILDEEYRVNKVRCILQRLKPFQISPLSSNHKGTRITVKARLVIGKTFPLTVA